jgi:hypothetical protein
MVRMKKTPLLAAGRRRADRRSHVEPIRVLAKQALEASEPHRLRPGCLRAENSAVNVLEHLTPQELASVLKILLARNRALREEAEEIAAELISSPSVPDIADDVFASVGCVDMNALNERSGRKPWGYVEPVEAACELLHEAVEDVIRDARRRMKLGLEEAAETMCRGIVIGLRRAQEEPSVGALEWAPDFPADEALHAVAELIRACRSGKRKSTRNRLHAVFARDVPDWAEMLDRAMNRAMSGKLPLCGINSRCK